jgi:hypothetical protein
MAQMYLRSKQCEQAPGMLALADAAYERALDQGQKPDLQYERRRSIVGDDIQNRCPTPSATSKVLWSFTVLGKVRGFERLPFSRLPAL